MMDEMNEIDEYGHLGSWYIKSTPYMRFFNWNKSFENKQVVTGETSFFVIRPFCTLHSLWLDICFWLSSFVWKCYVFNFRAFYLKTVLHFCEKSLRLSENLFQTWGIMIMFKISSDCHIKTGQSLKWRDILKISSTTI